MRSRIVSFKMVAPGELVEHPDNWREHPNTQKAALREVLQRVGIADVLLAYKSPTTKKLTLVDGHLRRELLAGQEKVPVVILDLNDHEARAVVASHDPIGAMALRDDDLYEQLLGAVEESADFADIVRMLDADGWSPPAEADRNEAFEAALPAEYPIAPQFDEGYDALIITTATESEWGQLMTLLQISKKRDRRGRVGTSHVLTFGEFIKLWHAREPKPTAKRAKKRRS